jgi:hypothetical protein
MLTYLQIEPHVKQPSSRHFLHIVLISICFILSGCVGNNADASTPIAMPQAQSNIGNKPKQPVAQDNPEQHGSTTITIPNKDENYNLLTPKTSIYCVDRSNECNDVINIGSEDNVINLHAYHTAPLGHKLNAQQVTYNSQIKKLIIVIHGLYGNNNVAFAAVSANHDIDTTVIAPYFGGKEKIDPATAKEQQLATWNTSSWMKGGLSDNIINKGRQLSSFMALSKLVNVALISYPNLKEIVFAGFSAGGQMLQRYVLFDMYPAEALKTKDISVRFIVSSPSSYVYLDGNRINYDTQCNDITSCDSLDKNSFSIPTAYTEEGLNCVNNISDKGYYNNYKYGLQNIPKYLEQDKTKLINNYLKANVTYLLNTGDASSITNNYLGNNIPAITDCPAVLEGPSNDSYRFQRGLVFTKYLHLFYPESIATHKVYIYDGKNDLADDGSYCSHNEYCVWGSAIGQNLLRGRVVQ